MGAAMEKQSCNSMQRISSFVTEASVKAFSAAVFVARKEVSDDLSVILRESEAICEAARRTGLLCFVDRMQAAAPSLTGEQSRTWRGSATDGLFSTSPGAMAFLN